MRTETIYIGTREEIVKMIESSPKNYRATSSYPLDRQLNDIEARHGKIGLIFMLGENHNEAGQMEIDKWWVVIQDHLVLDR